MVQASSISEPLYFSGWEKLPVVLPAVRGSKLTGHILTPQQVKLSQLLSSTTGPRKYTHRDPVVEMPRRAGKTTGIFNELLGRCITHNDYQATYIAQSGVKSRERFVTLKRELEQNVAGASGWKTRDSRGEERIEFANGSVLKFLPPKSESFRGDAGDVVVLDEAQELDPQEAAELTGAILPLFDTRPGGGQLIVAGTAGEARRGLLWDALQEGRAGHRGILEYAAPDDADPADEDVWVAAHPGIGTLTTLDIIRERHAKLSPEAFGREYLGLWPHDAASLGLTSEVWQSAGTERSEPTALVLAYDVAPDRSRSAIVGAWEDDGVHVEVIETAEGTAWLVERLGALSAKYNAPVLYDTAGGALDIADSLARLRPRPRTRGLSTQEYAAACAGFTARVLDGTLWHHRQPDLDAAVQNAKRRSIGDGLWGWGRKSSSSAICELVAATVAAYGLHSQPIKRSRQILVAR